MRNPSVNRVNLLAWWRLMRPHTLNAAVMPVLIGTALAYSQGAFRFLLFGAMMAASILIQAAVNMFNEYFDFKRGLDSVESVGIGGVIVREELDETSVFRMGVVSFSAAVVLGIYICANSTWWIALIGSLSMGVGYFYSAGERPLAYTAFGELASGTFMGLVIVLISYFIQAGALTLQAVLVSVPISILVAAILLANNIRDSEGDARKGRKTLAIVLGRERSITFLGAMFLASYVWTAGLVASGTITPFVSLSLLAIPKAISSIKTFRSNSTPAAMMPAMKATSRLHSDFGVLFSIGILAGRFLA
jgi:1,4-dihydroxy-2-naphthoate octaprenyltransferase